MQFITEGRWLPKLSVQSVLEKASFSERRF
jgi:hypothetical protein